MNKYIFTAILVIIAAYVVGDFMGAQHQLEQSKVSYTKSVCDRAHSEINGLSEEYCGQLQDETNTDYKCSSYAKDANCWLEEK